LGVITILINILLYCILRLARLANYKGGFSVWTFVSMVIFLIFNKVQIHGLSAGKTKKGGCCMKIILAALETLWSILVHMTAAALPT
jgi:hypothetical protein